MKKLMIAAAIVCAAAMSQAADYSWKMATMQYYKDGYKNDGTGTYTAKNLTSGTAYLFAAESSNFAEGYSAFTQQQLLDYLNDSSKGTVAENWAALTTGAETKKAIAFTSIGSTGMSTAKTISYAGVEPGDSRALYAYAAILVQDGDKSFVYISNEGNQAAQASATPNLFVGASATTTSQQLTDATEFGGAKWYQVGAAAVPEPTSGLLLLIGVAGLALRRRRA